MTSRPQTGPLVPSSNASPFPFDNLEQAYTKVNQWKRVAQHSVFAALAGAVDLTVHPSTKRATFPGLTPFEILHEQDILKRLVSIPSTWLTALVSVAFGATVTVVLLSGRLRVPASGSTPSAVAGTVSRGGRCDWRTLRRGVRGILRTLTTLALTVLFLRFLRKRRPTAKLVSTYANVSCCADGPCIVADRVLMMTNSHAGTHADTPQHFSRLITVRDYDPAHYTGDAVVLDLREALLLFSLNGRAITRAVLIEAVTHELPAAYRDGTRQLWRLLVVTRPRPSPSLLTALDGTLATTSHDKWEDRCAYFEPTAVQYLADTFPHLLLVGIDAPSVDDDQFAPITDGSHGAMLEKGIAILENLDFSGLESRLLGSSNESATDAQHTRCIEGGMLTVFNPVLSFDDSKGCCVLFLPPPLVSGATDLP